MREDEANFVAYLACRASENAQKITVFQFRNLLPLCLILLPVPGQQKIHHTPIALCPGLLIRYREDRRSADVLLQKRSENKDSFPGSYDISSAGHIPSGVDFLESALRELEEELGIPVP